MADFFLVLAGIAVVVGVVLALASPVLLALALARWTRLGWWPSFLVAAVVTIVVAAAMNGGG